MRAVTPRSRGSLGRVLALVVLVAACSFVAAQGPGSRTGGPSGKPGSGPPGGADNGTVEQAKPSPGDESTHVLVAPLRYAAAGTLVVDGGRVDAPLAWARFLAPGMWLRLEGRWDGGIFRATAVEVSRPAYFSYYLGPAAPVGLGKGWVEAWFAADAPDAAGVPLEVRRIDREHAPLTLARSIAGAWVALPPGLEPASPTADGWTLFQGRTDGDAVRWTSASPFP